MVYREAEPMGKEMVEVTVENGIEYHLAEDGCYYPDISAEQSTDCRTALIV